MGLKLAFELTDKDLSYFRSALRQAREAVRDAEEAEIIEAIRDVMTEIRRNEPLPDFVAQRLPQIDMMISMLQDDEWQLPLADREHLLATFVYFGDPEDLLADDIPVIGYLDDVIILELVKRELLHVREAYEDYCRFRDDFDRDDGKAVDPAIRRDRLDRRRQQLHQRMKRRTRREQKKSLW
ncbi:MAG: YkvA family protein [Pseudomonadota bacterium]